MEIEAKYAVGDPETFDRLRLGEPAGRYKFVFLSEHDANDVYLDTTAQHLMRAGWVLRIREGVQPGRAAVTLKSRGRTRGAIHRREEIEMMVPAGTPPTAWPASALLRKVHDLTGGEPLAEALRLRQHRVLHDVRRAKRTVAVRFLDQVTFEAGSRVQTSLEMEVELTQSGSLEDLHALDEIMRADHVQPQARSKFERALEWADESNGGGAATARPAAMVGTSTAGAPGFQATETHPKPKPPTIAPQDDIVEAGRRVLAFHAQRMQAHEPALRAGDADALHDMRVAIRRQRSLLRILAPWMRRKTVRQFRSRLHDAGAALGGVRDLDVMIHAAEEYATLRGRGRGAALQPLIIAWTQERGAARAGLIGFLDDSAWPKFCARYGAFLEAPRAKDLAVEPKSGRQGERVPHRVAHILPPAIWSHYAALRAYEPGHAAASFETLHCLRVEAKHLRYLLEFFKSALDPSPSDAIQALVAVQDHLGAMNDAHLAASRVRSFLEAAAASGNVRTLIAVRAYLEHVLAERARRRAESEPLWSAVAGVEFKQQLAHACAVL